MNTTHPMTAPLKGWVRLERISDGVTLDFNLKDSDHAALYERFKNSPNWRRVNVDKAATEELPKVE